ncbi:MAG TPA: hypothetical protein PK629_09415 [Oscillospiraceae bacterium]|nr:hypothetical protein [Oscillospiraceae bacterium]HPF54970.1 hypothetical protein [Clostridiales bacterium]HPK34383.1 hypothetical protein [Oscillospiraceae bacterium]HPR75829.1 hypothetical protein [Oscillospiraceae bacterium]
MKKEEFEKYYKNAKPLFIDKDDLESIKPLTKQKYQPGFDKWILKYEAEKDIDVFFKILQFSYAGYDYYKDKINFIDVKNQILAELPEKDITTTDFGKVIHHALYPYITDSHFVFLIEGEYSFKKLYRAYFTDLLLELKDDSYIVIKGNEDIKEGYCFSYNQVKDYLFETLPATNGNKRYLLGIYTLQFPNNISINGYELLLHPCKTDDIQQIKEGVKIDIINGVPIVHHSTYSFKSPQPSFDEYRELGQKYKNTEYLVWSILSNNGGNSEYPKSFIMGLNDYAIWTMSAAVLNNPSLENLLPLKSFKIYEEGSINLACSNYKGTLYIIQNKKVASSGESAIMYGRCVRNKVFVGSASMGCGQFGDTLLYKLPYSNLFFSMGYKVFNMNGFEEGKGIYPDYWLDSQDPVNDVVRFILLRKEL